MTPPSSADGRESGVDRRPAFSGHEVQEFLCAPLHHGAADRPLEREQVFARLRRDDVERPTFLVGMGTCGVSAGAVKTLRAIRCYIEDKTLDADVVDVGCLGLCWAEPLVSVQLPGRQCVSFANVGADDIAAVLSGVLDGRLPDSGLLGQSNQEGLAAWEGVPLLERHAFLAGQTRSVLANSGYVSPWSIDEYLAHGGYQGLAKAVHLTTRPELCDLVESSGLRGRGGGGYATGSKWRAALSTSGYQKYLICNADESDPGAFVDRALIEGDPHRLIEGLSIAAYAVGATRAYICIRSNYTRAVEVLTAAVEQAREYGLIGENVLGSGSKLEIAIQQVAGAFVCGEETALIESLEGRRGRPRPRPPYPALSGLFDKPTVVNNVETLANVPGIVLDGGEAFRSRGTEKSKGTKVFALSGKIRLNGFVEVAMGTTLRELVFDIGGGPKGEKDLKAVFVGGPLGGCIPAHQLDVAIDYESLKEAGARLGSGGLVAVDESNCMVDMAKFFMDFIRRESCGRCIPCREGTRHMFEILQSLTRSRRNESTIETLERFKGVMYLNRLADVIRDTSLCGLGRGAPNPVLSTLRWFREEYEDHVYDRRCPTGTCTELLHYHIDTEKCEGCGECASQCPADAIVGVPKSPHFVVDTKCIACGVCVPVCPVDAVIAE